MGRATSLGTANYPTTRVCCGQILNELYPTHHMDRERTCFEQTWHVSSLVGAWTRDIYPYGRQPTRRLTLEVQAKLVWCTITTKCIKTCIIYHCFCCSCDQLYSKAIQGKCCPLKTLSESGQDQYVQFGRDHETLTKSQFIQFNQKKKKKKISVNACIRDFVKLTLQDPNFTCMGPPASDLVLFSRCKTYEYWPNLSNDQLRSFNILTLFFSTY